MEKFEVKKLEEKKREAEIQPPEFEIKKFEAARESFENLTKKLTPAIKRHEYNLIIGDDASGRLTTRVIGGLLREAYEEDKLDAPQILFFAGRGEVVAAKEKTVERISNYLKELIDRNKIKPSKGKALLTTEYIGTGATMFYFAEAVKKAGLSCDIAALGLGKPFEIYKRQKMFKDIKVYNGGHRLRRHGELAGVEKEKGKIFAIPLKEDRLKVEQSRRDAKKMIDYLKQIYDREKEKIEKTKE